MQHIYEDILDDLERIDAGSEAKIISDDEIESHLWPDEQIYRIGFNIEIRKKIEYFDLKVLKERVGDFLDSCREVDERSSVEFQQFDRFLKFSFPDGVPDNQEFSYIQFVFSVNPNQKVRDIKSAFRFIKKIYSKFKNVSEIKIYENDTDRRITQSFTNNAADRRILNRIFKIIDGKKTNCPKGEFRTDLIERIANIGEIFFRNKDFIADESFELAAKQDDIYSFILVSNYESGGFHNISIDGNFTKKIMETKANPFTFIDDFIYVKYIVPLYSGNRKEFSEQLKKQFEENPPAPAGFDTHVSNDGKTFLVRTVWKARQVNVDGVGNIGVAYSEVTFSLDLPEKRFIRKMRETVCAGFDEDDYKKLMATIQTSK